MSDVTPMVPVTVPIFNAAPFADGLPWALGICASPSWRAIANALIDLKSN